MTTDAIQIRGAREHNLQGVDVDIPRGRLTVFTGVSGSGKSSLAFDTLYAEGQRRYVESLSAYARQFLGQMSRPRYDTIRGLTPTIAVSQSGGSRNPRSTVGTLTEIHDHLRVLFARTGVQHCPRCDRIVERTSVPEVAHRLKALAEGTRFQVLAPVLREAPGSQRELLDTLRKAGFARVRVDGEALLLDDLVELAPRRSHTVEVVVDRLERRDGADERLADSLETAFKVGQGRLLVAVAGAPDLPFTERLLCPACDLAFTDLTPARFSFNSPQGACPACDGLGVVNEIDPRKVVPDPSLTLHQGAIQPWKGPLTRKDGWNYAMIVKMAETLSFDLDTPWDQLPEGARRALLYGTAGETFTVEWAGTRHRTGTFETDWEGAIPAMQRRMKETKSEEMRAFYLDYLSNTCCPSCHGERLCAASLAVRVGPYRIVDLERRDVSACREALAALGLAGARATIAEDLVKEIRHRLQFLEDVGLGYLTLDRAADTLSGGESQRIRLASQLGGELTGVTYVLDEPSIGLHPRDTDRLVRTLQRLRDLGNTVVVVEHDRSVIEAADHVVDFGPGAGRLGGRVVAAGPPASLPLEPASLTGQYLAGARRIGVPATRRPPGDRRLRVLGAREHNLAGIDVDIPLGLMVAITGVSGAGKSSLVDHILSPALHNGLHHANRPVGACDRVTGVGLLTRVIDVDQSAIGRSPRSNPATYTKVFDLVRDVFAQTKDAKIRGYGAARFSFNQKGGRCEACTGDGWRRIEMHFLADVSVPCEVCRGRRFNDATLEVKYRGHDIAQVLDLPVSDALDLFAAHPAIARILSTLVEVGLGYLRLGQPSDTLSGGEAQRVKLSRELGRPEARGTLYLLDEPTTGLHFEDVRRLVEVLGRLVDAGSTVVVVEHNPEVVACCDHVVDLGPEGGAAGGRVVVAGTPEEVARCAASHTGRALAGVLGGR